MVESMMSIVLLPLLSKDASSDAFYNIITRSDDTPYLALPVVDLTSCKGFLIHISGLEYIDMSFCRRRNDLPNSFFLLPKLASLRIDGCSPLEPPDSGSRCLMTSPSPPANLQPAEIKFVKTNYAAKESEKDLVETMAKYKGAELGEQSPHPFAIVGYRKMLDEEESQAILVSGEGGVGKTKSTKMLMHYLAYLRGRFTNVVNHDNDIDVFFDQIARMKLKVKCQDGNEIFFSINKSTQLKKHMNAYCSHHSVVFNSIGFMFNKHHIRTEQSPNEMQMMDLEINQHATTFFQWDPGGWSHVCWRSQHAWEAFYLNENSGSSSLEVEETDAGGFYY